MEKENIMGTEKISRLVIMTGIPLMLSLLINSLYNDCDAKSINLSVNYKYLIILVLDN